MRHPARSLCVLAIPVLAAGASLAAPPEKRQPPPVRVLIDRSLQETTIRLARIGPSGITFTTESEPAEAPARTRPLSDVLALVPVAGSAAPARPVSREAAPLVAVTTTDGQRLIGHIRARPASDKPGDAATSLVFEGPFIGTLQLPLDVVSEVELIETGAGPPTTPGKDDTVVLANGDRIDGFVESIGTEVVVKPAGSEAEVRIPLERALRIRLANRSAPTAGTLLWLADGSVVALDGPPESEGATLKCTLRHTHAPFTIPLSSASALALDAHQVRPLGSLTLAGHTTAPERRWSRPPRVLDARGAPLGAADIEIPGPMSTEWVLPPGAARLAGTAELAASTQGWGDCEVVVEDLSQGAPPRRLFSKRLNAQTPAARFDVAFTPSTSAEHRLRITVESGQRGPIQDRVYLRRPLLLVAD